MIKRPAFIVVFVVVVGGVAVFFDAHHYIRFYATPSQVIPGSADVDVELVGSYYFGDGLGVNPSLTLQPDGTFRCDWSGCLGDYGSSTGVWAADGNTLFVSTTAADGMFLRAPLENMTIVQYDGAPHFLEGDWGSLIDEFGDDVIPDATFSPIQ